MHRSLAAQCTLFTLVLDENDFSAPAEWKMLWREAPKGLIQMPGETELKHQVQLAMFSWLFFFLFFIIIIVLFSSLLLSSSS